VICGQQLFAICFIDRKMRGINPGAILSSQPDMVVDTRGSVCV